MRVAWSACIMDMDVGTIGYWLGVGAMARMRALLRVRKGGRQAAPSEQYSTHARSVFLPPAEPLTRAPELEPSIGIRDTSRWRDSAFSTPAGGKHAHAGAPRPVRGSMHCSTACGGRNDSAPNPASGSTAHPGSPPRSHPAARTSARRILARTASGEEAPCRRRQQSHTTRWTGTRCSKVAVRAHTPPPPRRRASTPLEALQQQ